MFLSFHKYIVRERVFKLLRMCKYISNVVPTCITNMLIFYHIVSFPSQVLQGSHKCGRIDHLIVAEQTGADVERVREIEKVCPKVYVELDEGKKLSSTTIFFCRIVLKRKG